jgi:hypothetical protein
VSPRPGDQLFFGQVSAELLERAKSSILFVSGEPPISEREPDKIPTVEEHPTAPLVLHER